MGKIDTDKDVGEYVAEVNAMEGPRVFKSHAPIEQFEFSHANTHPDAKIIYVTRNSQDNLRTSSRCFSKELHHLEIGLNTQSIGGAAHRRTNKFCSSRMRK